MSCRFVVLSDTHFTPPPSNRQGSWWNRSTERLSDRMGGALVELIKKLSPDFIIHCGDFVGLCSRDSFEFGASVMDRLGCPWFAVTGNHDTWCMDIRDCFRETFKTGNDSSSYMRDLFGLRFLFFDVVHWYAYDDTVSPVLDIDAYHSGKIETIGPLDKDIAWIEEALHGTTLPTVLVSHAPVAYRETYPVVTLPHGKPVKGPATAPADFIPDINCHDRLLDITQRNTRLKACFAGHWHINDVVRSNDVWYVMTGALREFPYDIRLVEYTGDSFRISTHRLDVPDLMELSYVKEWGNRWVEGNEDVRTVTCRFR